MAEVDPQSTPVFIDVASGQIQYPIGIVISDSPATVTNSDALLKNVKIEVDVEPSVERSTSPLSNYLNIQPRRIRCTECQKYTAETEEKMLRHVRKVHRGENPFQCYMCDYSTYNKSLFEEHVRIHQGIKPFKCSHCSYRSASKKNAKKHELIHSQDNPRRCKHCGFIARHLKSLMHHISKEHGIWQQGNNTEEKPTTLCQGCNKTFHDLEAHKKNKTKCSKCELYFCSKHLLRKHGLVRHGDKEKVSRADFTCEICKWQSNLKAKILLHLIHHPNQAVDKNVVDVRILKACGIKGPGW